MPIFMKVEGIKGSVIEAARSGTGGTTDDVVVDGRIITGENWASAAADTGTHEVGHLLSARHDPAMSATDSLSLNYSKIVWSDAASTEPGLLTMGETETRAGGHAQWTEFTSFSNGAHRGGETAWDGGLHVVASDFDVI